MMFSAVIKKEWYEEIKDRVECVVVDSFIETHFDGKLKIEKVEIEYNNEELFEEVSKELGWIE